MRKKDPSNRGKIAIFLMLSLLVHNKGVFGLEIPQGSVLGKYLNLDAEKISISKERGVLEATGEVRLVYEGMEIKAGKLSYYFEREIIELTGGVNYFDKDMEFSFSKIEIDIRAKKSILYDGFVHVKSEHLIVSAERFEEVTEDKYKIYKAKFTTCDECEKADWRIKIGKGTLTLGGYATGTNISLNIRDKPFFWFPYAFFPAKAERESGFLFPNFSSSETKGTRVIFPLYIVTSSFSDLTLYMDYMSKRGFKPEGELRYRLTEVSQGKLSGSYIDDRVTSDRRGRVKYSTNVSGNFPFFATANIDYAFDANYYIDFEDDISLRTRRQIISDASTGYEGRQGVIELYSTYVKDISSAIDDRETIQVVPALKMELKKKRIFYDLYSRASLELKNFHTRSEGSTQKGNITLETELPVSLGDAVLVNIYSDLIDGFYYFENQGMEKSTENFIYWDTRGTVKTSLYRKFALKEKELGHRIEPYFTLQKTSRISGFSPEIFEPEDRAPEKTRIIFGFRNLFSSFYGDGRIRDTGGVDVKYSYDFERKVDSSSNLIDPFSEYFRTYQDQIDIAVDGSLSENLRSDLYLDGYLKPSEYTEFNAEGFYDTSRAVLDKLSFGLNYDDKDNTFLSLMIRHTRTLATDLNLGYKNRIFRWLRVNGWLNYSLKDDVVIENTSFFEYIPRSECWSLTIGASRKTRPAETSYSLFFSLRGLGAIGK